MTNKRVIVWDLDGTLACGKHRLHLLPTKDYDVPSSWDSFNLACVDDAPIQDNIDLLRSQFACGFHIVILTGRSDVAAQQTKDWLRKHMVPYGRLIMRGYDDSNTDVTFKEARLRAIGPQNILCAFDDLEHVAKHMRGMGITCHLVTHYDTDARTAAHKPREELSE